MWIYKFSWESFSGLITVFIWCCAYRKIQDQAHNIEAGILAGHVFDEET